MARAIEQTRMEVEQIITEARNRQCFVYKGHADVRSHIITLHFSNIAGDKFSRTINCFSIFENQGVEFELGDALTIMGEVDELVLSSGKFQEYRIAKSIRGDRQTA